MPSRNMRCNVSVQGLRAIVEGSIAATSAWKDAETIFEWRST
jgi:hypothetical protein